MRILAALFVALPCAVALAQSVTIDPTIEYQTMDGFGGFGAKKVPWDSPPLWDQKFVDTVINDLGLTILRVEVPANFEHENDNGRKNDKGYWDGDVGTLNLAGFNVDKPVDGTHQPFSSQIPYIKAMKATADKSKQPLKVIASIWTPPAWMKYVNSVFGQDHTWNRLSDGTHAHPNYYPEFAEFCEGYVRIFKRETGVDLYALSLQNEPFFAQSYQSCVYSPEQLREVIKVVGERFRKNGINTKIFGPEDVSVFARIKGYIVAACEDPIARQYLDVLAVHGYAEGGTRADESGARVWSDTFDLARRYDKPLWQTETSGYPDSFDGALRLAEHMHTALQFGNISAWVWWSLSEDKPSEYSLMADGRPTSRYYASKQFYRFIRPGAVRIACETGDDEVVATAYKHAADKTLTIVFINRDDEGRSIVLRGDGLPPELAGYVTTAKDNCASAGKFRREVQVMLPPRSIMTLVGAGYQPAQPAPGPRIATQPADATIAEGERAEFAVALANPFPWDGATFQWLRNGKPIAGATTPVLTISAATSGDNGASYVVDVAMQGKTVRSEPAKLAVTPFAGVAIARTKRPPAIGEVDDSWKDAKPYPIGKLLSGTVDSEKDLSGTVRALWDDQALYVMYDVTDDARRTGIPLDRGSFNNDSVELYIDADNSKSASYGKDDFQYVFVVGTGKLEEVKNQATREVTFGTLEPKVPGYSVQVRIPWTTLGATPRAGQFIGFDAHVNDNDAGDGREAKIGWFATKDDLWETPSRMGTAKLAE